MPAHITSIKSPALPLGRINFWLIMLVSIVAVTWPIALRATESPTALSNATAENIARIQTQLKISDQRRDELAAEIARLKKDRTVLSRALVETAARNHKLEDKIQALETRLKELDGRKIEIRSDLRQRRGILAKVLASLQRMGNNPPPALLVRPRDALASVRTAILLGAVVPELRAETALVVSRLRELVDIQSTTVKKRNALKLALVSLGEDEIRLSLLLDQKTNLQAKRREQFAAQQKEVEALAQRATSLKALVAELKRRNEKSEKLAKAAKQQDDLTRSDAEKRLAAARNTGLGDSGTIFPEGHNIAPRIAFSKARGLLPRPVRGVEVQSYDDITPSGDRTNGISIATRINARVVAPADANVVYAGPFRSYGRLIILNAGEDHHIVLAGMERVNVTLGQSVLAGEPIGQMGARRVASSSITVVGSTRPVLYVEFRKNDKSFDPTPWWVPASLKRPTNDS